MFFLARHNNDIICNLQGLLELEKLVSDLRYSEEINIFINSNQSSVSIGCLSINKIMNVFTVLSIDGNWSISIEKKQFSYFLKKCKNNQKTEYIIIFDGYNFKFFAYDKAYVSNLVTNYFCKDIYIGVSLSDVYTDVYSTNHEGLRILYNLLSYFSVILMYLDNIKKSLSKSDTEAEFIFDNETGFKIIDSNYLIITANGPSYQYKIHKDVFFKLLNKFNEHKHAANKMCCAKTTIIIDDKDVYVELID